MHSHILPGIDDGAANFAESLEMLRMAAADGVTTQVLTPHIHLGRYDNTRESVESAFATFRERVREAGIAIDLALGAEVRIGAEVLQLVVRDGVPWLGSWEGKKVFLMEFPHSQLPVGSINLVRWLVARDILPLIAHPERNRALQANPHKLGPLLAEGCLLQLTAGSLTGNFGPAARELAESLLRSGQVTLLATDCHNLSYRPPDLGAGLAAATRLIGSQAAEELVLENPRRLLDRP
jgi:protein-tyrosine phosphatase